MVYTWVPLVTGRVLGMVQFQRSWLAPVAKPLTAHVVVGIAVPFRSTWMAVMLLAPVRLVPPSVTPCGEPLLRGTLSEVIAGGGGSTLKTTAPVVPPGVVTVILRFPWTAVLAMAKLAVICVELTTVRPVTTMPVPALID